MACCGAVGPVHVAGLQMACSGAPAKVFDLGVAAVIAARLEHESGGMRRIGSDLASVDAFTVQRGGNKAAECVVSQAAQVTHAQTQPREADGYIELSPGRGACK